ncbi:MAG: hypothetical protein AB7I18_00165 [Candidatus Berkiella sp.]
MATHFTPGADRLAKASNTSIVPDRIVIDSRAQCSFTLSLNEVLDRVARDDVSLTHKKSNRP